MQRHERLAALFEIITDRESATVDELAAEMGVSAATIRRDLDQLAVQQLVVRTHGGAMSAPISSDLPMRYKTSAGRGKEKRRIAHMAASLALPGEVIGLNGGTTTTEVARELALREDLHDGPNDQVTVLTNAVNIANELAVRPQMRVVLTGGVVRPMTFELIGPLANPVLESLDIGTLFLGCEAIGPKGAYTEHDGEAAINATLVNHAHRVVVVADHTKFGARSFAKICGLGRIDTVVTDSKANPDIVQQLRDARIEVILV